jgi:CRP-like cAMP-binding protein
MDIKKFLLEYGFDISQIEEISSKLIPITLKKGDNFLKLGEKTQALGILINGLLYSTYIDKNGNEWISRFFYLPNNFIVSNHECFFFSKLSTETIKAYEQSHIMAISKTDLDSLGRKHSQIESMIRVLAEESYIQALKRIHELQSLSAKQRLQKFITDHNELFVKIPRQHIASYLGVHRNILTRILREL